MWLSEVSVDIEAPAADVYGYLADFARHREWSSAAMAELNQLTPSPVGVGSEFVAAETVRPRSSPKAASPLWSLTGVSHGILGSASS